ncbi:serpin family protein [Eubacterium xylanophilum]|uniref:serpin family protein n=1 Tax=Eubacterium xylanophilum TaxID=39497 RepID=UPI0004B8D4AE|nr:serpin family protein [Eubacterium xylanophilum]
MRRFEIKDLTKMTLVCMSVAALSASVISTGVEAKKKNPIKPKVTKKIELKEGKSKKISVKGRFVVSKKFKSSKPTVAKVGKKGKVTALKAGNCKITIKVKYKKKKKAKKTFTKKYICKVKVTANNKTVIRQEGEEKPVSDKFVKQMSKVSLDLIQRVSKKAKANENILISPESIVTASMLAANGAENDTLSEFENTLCGELGLKGFNEDLSTYNDNLMSSVNVDFSMANSIWAKDQKGFSIKDSYKEVVKKYYNAETLLEPFDKNTVEKINSWVKKNTDNMIDKIIDNIPSDARAYLINALAFTGEWAEQYRDGSVKQGEKFTDASGKEKDATMLVGSEYGYVSGENFTGFTKPYKGGRYEFMALLPKEGMTTAELLASFEEDDLSKIYKNEERGMVYTKMPEFKYSYETALKDVFMDMGIKNAFDSGKANFTNMATFYDNIFIDDILHKTFIELDRNGTKAAAVTVVAMRAASAYSDPKEVVLDRPFVYAIVNSKTGLPVFVGVVNTL